MRLRAVLGQLVAMTLANGCTEHHIPSCPDNEVTTEIGSDADFTLKELVAACDGTQEACAPLCKELLTRQVLGNEPEAILGSCTVDKHSDVTATVKYEWFILCGGRRPHAMPACARIASVRDWLREQGRLEAASVTAFAQLARDLAVHRAPRSLVGACRRAARDEARHAQACGASRPARCRRATPSLEALAIDNAIDGEVRETWGAVVGAWQAQRATAPAIRRMMRGIAPDELRHAELAARLGRFYASRLSAAARARVAAAKARAIDELDIGELPAPLANELGLPSREAGAALLAGLRAQVWRA
jgi:hypothetical protein